MRKPTVLFLCVHNSARSQMAEELLRHHCGERFNVESAGLEPGTLNPLAVEALREIGIDIQGKATQSVWELYRQGRLYSHVITVCDESNAERCPIFPGRTERLHWGFPDPSAFEGTWEERLDRTRRVRDDIDARIAAWCAELCAPEPAVAADALGHRGQKAEGETDSKPTGPQTPNYP